MYCVDKLAPRWSTLSTGPTLISSSIFTMIFIYDGSIVNIVVGRMCIMIDELNYTFINAIRLMQVMAGRPLDVYNYTRI